VNKERQVTVLLTTHDLTDIERLCSRVMVIDHGQLVYDGALGGLHALTAAQRTLVIDLVESGSPVTVDGASVLRVDGPRQWLAFPVETSAAPLVASLIARYPIADLAIEEPDIEDVITQIYAQGLPRHST